ncbi:hypothetical protein [Longimicrobium sp.]|uniref:hypothetical protein n=1 Tax=Longimicrobium sp. TaxID=2029185 RepID=UPI002E30B077|nr:hypothetical protein [Longimicrobium sp.]HEX6038794.1 hypothetical protein [Longimicrobium sp.]
MLMILMMGALALAGVGAARLTARAFAAEHLVLLRAHGEEAWLFERDGDGRYHRLPLSGLPGALRRFACGVPATARLRADV